MATPLLKRGGTKRLPIEDGKRKVLPPVHPNAGLEAAYRKRLTSEVEAMHASVLYWMAAAYKANPTAIAQDGPVDALRRAFRRLARRWIRRIDDMAPKMADWFVANSGKRADGAMAQILKDGGWTVDLQLTPQVRDILKAATTENVGLIKSIAQQYLTHVEGCVMRSAMIGGDVGGLTKEIQAQFGVSKRRAAFIARDQTNKATAVITRARQQEIGITQALWTHSSAGKHPRPEHVAADGKPYDVAKGMWLEGKWTWPGHEINCRCISRSIVPGFFAEKVTQ
jgi:SPP1 gp7 family putative phage head morphogenesis protein